MGGAKPLVGGVGAVARVGPFRGLGTLMRDQCGTGGPVGGRRYRLLMRWTEDAPTHCPNGHELGPGRVLVGWTGRLTSICSAAPSPGGPPPADGSSGDTGKWSYSADISGSTLDERLAMRAALATAATMLLALAGCSSGAEPGPEPAPSSTSVAPVEPTETPIVLGDPFTIAGPNYTAHVTIERVYKPERCGEYPARFIALDVDVDVEAGDGTREVLNTGTIRERDPDGYITRERTISTSCGDIDELEARNAQRGDKFRGARWLAEDVDPQSEILINTPTAQGAPITEVFVLNLGEIDLEATPEPAPAPEPEPAAAPASSGSSTTGEPRSIWAPPGQGHRCPGTDARVWDFADCNPSNGVIDPEELNRMVEQQNQQPAHDGVPIADGGTCPAYLCGYGHDEHGNPHPSSGEVQTQNGCEAGYITDAEQCAAVGVPIG